MVSGLPSIVPFTSTALDACDRERREVEARCDKATKELAMPIVQTQEVAVRYCEDCKYFAKDDMCSHPLTERKNLIKRDAAKAFCTVARGDFGTVTTCGPDARYFREREIVRIPTPRHRFAWLPFRRSE